MSTCLCEVHAKRGMWLAMFKRSYAGRDFELKLPVSYGRLVHLRRLLAAFSADVRF